MAAAQQQRLTVLVTGASRGIGLELTRQLLSRNHAVIAACRAPDAAAELQAMRKSHERELRLVRLDVEDRKSVEAAAASLADVAAIDMLINNAGVASKNHPVDPALGVDPDDFMRVMRVNALGPILVTQAFWPKLSKAPFPRIVNMSSNLGSIAKSRGGCVSYRCSKSALNQLTRCLQQELHSACVISIHPGWVKTDMGSSGGRDPDITAESSVRQMLDNVIDKLRKEHSGQFFSLDGSTLPW